MCAGAVRSAKFIVVFPTSKPMEKFHVKDLRELCDLSAQRRCRATQERRDQKLKTFYERKLWVELRR